MWMQRLLCLVGFATLVAGCSAPEETEQDFESLTEDFCVRVCSEVESCDDEASSCPETCPGEARARYSLCAEQTRAVETCVLAKGIFECRFFADGVTIGGCEEEAAALEACLER